MAIPDRRWGWGGSGKWASMKGLVETEEVSRGLFSGDHGSGLYPSEVTVTFKNITFSRFFPRKMYITNTQTFDVQF